MGCFQIVCVFFNYRVWPHEALDFTKFDDYSHREVGRVYLSNDPRRSTTQKWKFDLKSKEIENLYENQGMLLDTQGKDVVIVSQANNNKPPQQWGIGESDTQH